jgi:hypothetical protein
MVYSKIAILECAGSNTGLTTRSNVVKMPMYVLTQLDLPLEPDVHFSEQNKEIRMHAFSNSMRSAVVPNEVR